MKSWAKKVLIITPAVFIFLITFLLCLYKWGLPALVNSRTTEVFIEDLANQILNTDVNIEKMRLKTGWEIAFTVDRLSIDKDGNNYLALSELDTLFSLREIFKRKIIVKKILAKNIYADAYNLSNLFPKEEKKKKKKKSFIRFDFYNTLLGIKNVLIVYHSPDFIMDVAAKHAIFDRTGQRKFLHLDFKLNIQKAGRKIEISANDQNRIFMENHVAYIKDFPIEIEQSKIVINANMTNKGLFEIDVAAKNFNANDIAEIVNSNLVVANGSHMLEPVKNIDGTVNFNIRMKKNDFNADISINEVNFKIVPLMNMPVKITGGKIKIGNSDIIFSDFKGFYNNKKTNTLNMKGTTKDYHKTCDTKLDFNIFVTNDFFKNYLSKMLGSPVELVGDSMSKLIIKSKNGSVNILWYFLLKENHGFKFGDMSMVLKEYKSFFKVDLSIVKNILKINTINYHITKQLKRGLTPLVKIKGNLDMADNMKILDLDIKMPRPLPSEFLNFLSCQKIFKSGNVSGEMSIYNHGKVATMNGEFMLEKVFVPAQRLYVRSAKLKAQGNRIALVSEGRLRREQYKFDGYILNELKLPIIVKDVNLKLDSIDLEKILEAETQPANATDNQNAKQALVSTGAEGEEDSEVLPPFQKGLLIIEKCSLNLLRGVYKEILFGNIHADLTLDNDGVLKIKSNRFDIADGQSSLRVNADLVNRKFNFKLGVKDVDSDIMATSILGLPRQISGKAKGFLNLTADEKLRLNGDIKFRVNNGTIGQVGYVEYILKVASLFRNPLAMISPSLLTDLVSIPDGKFDDIQGEMMLDNNIIKRMKITSTSPQLATLIFGRYDLSSNDASLRIYTKITDKGKGFAGVLRNISLNSIAAYLPISARNERNYYASELEMIPKLDDGEERAQVFLTKIDGDVINYNFLSSLKRIK